MKILSSLTHPQVVSNLYECLCSVEHKGRYSEECGKQSSSGAPLTSIVFFFLLWKSMVLKTAWLQTFFRISSFVFGRTKKLIQVWKYLRVSKWWQNCHFWVNYPFKGDLLCKNHFYKLFEHSCVAAVCENNQPIMLKIQQLIFFIKPINHKQSLRAGAVSDSPSVHVTEGKKSRPFVTLSALLA